MVKAKLTDNVNYLMAELGIHADLIFSTITIAEAEIKFLELKEEYNQPITNRTALTVLRRD